jgi:putative ATPase
LFTISGGDARKILNLIELCAEVMKEGEELTDKKVMEIAQQRIAYMIKAASSIMISSQHL